MFWVSPDLTCHARKLAHPLLSAASHSDVPGPIRVLRQKKLSELVGFIDTLGPICQLNLRPHRFLRWLYFFELVGFIDALCPSYLSSILAHPSLSAACHSIVTGPIQAPWQLFFWPSGLYRCFRSNLLLVFLGPSMAFGSSVK